MTLNEEQKTEIENQHNVYVDIESMSYNREGYDSAYGWQAIPLQWIEEDGIQ